MYTQLSAEQARPLLIAHARRCPAGYDLADAAVTLMLLQRGEIVCAVAPGGIVRTRRTGTYMEGREEAWLN
jgi:hypothetical protein